MLVLFFVGVRRGATRADIVQATERNLPVVEEVKGLHSVNVATGATPTSATSLSTRSRKDFRFGSGGLRQFWGPLCGWCSRMARIRLAHLNAAGIQSHLVVAENRPAFKLRSYAYVSIRAEGRNQVGVEMLESRALVLQQCMRLVQTDENFYQYSSLSDFIARNPEHDPLTITLVQMVADGQKVLGVRELVPSPQRCADSLTSTLPIDHRIRTDSAADLQSLKALEVALAKAVAGGSSGSGASIVGVAPQLVGSPAA